MWLFIVNAETQKRNPHVLELICIMKFVNCSTYWNETSNEVLFWPQNGTKIVLKTVLRVCVYRSYSFSKSFIVSECVKRSSQAKPSQEKPSLAHGCPLQAHLTETSLDVSKLLFASPLEGCSRSFFFDDALSVI